jgi:methionyl-tRNA formyltransferase
MEKLRIVFMEHEFAVGILDTIIKTTIPFGSLPPINQPVVDKIKIFCIKEYALANNLRLLQPTNLKRNRS